MEEVDGCMALVDGSMVWVGGCTIVIDGWKVGDDIGVLAQAVNGTVVDITWGTISGMTGTDASLARGSGRSTIFCYWCDNFETRWRRYLYITKSTTLFILKYLHK